MKKFVRLLIAASLFPIVALAQDSETREGETFLPSKYGAISFVLGIDQFQDADDFDYNEGFGAEIVIGYRGHQYFAGEAEFVYMQGIDQSGPSVDVEYEIFTANLKFYPFAGKFEPYLLGGIGGGRLAVDRNSDSMDEAGAVFRLGVGIETNVSDTFGLMLGANYLFTKGDIAGFDVLEAKLGVITRFW